MAAAGSIRQARRAGPNLPRAQPQWVASKQLNSNIPVYAMHTVEEQIDSETSFGSEPVVGIRAACGSAGGNRAIRSNGLQRGQTNARDWNSHRTRSIAGKPCMDGDEGSDCAGRGGCSGALTRETDPDIETADAFIGCTIVTEELQATAFGS